METISGTTIPKQQAPGQAPGQVTLRPVKVIHKRIEQFQNIPVDGVWGMINQNGTIQLELFVEKAPIPSILNYPVKDGQLSQTFEETYAEGERPGQQFIVVREFQAALILSLAGAMQLHHVIGNFIDIARQQMKEVEAQFKAELEKKLQK